MECQEWVPVMRLYCMAIVTGIICVSVNSLRVRGENMCSQMRSKILGIYAPFFVATNGDRSGCVHMALGAR